MERWETELVEEMKRSRSPHARSTPEAPAAQPDRLQKAFEDVAARTELSVGRVAEALDVKPQKIEEREAGRCQWSLLSRRLLLRLDQNAKKFFVSVESEASIEITELWIENDTLMTDADGAARPADVAQLTQRFVTLLFRGA